MKSAKSTRLPFVVLCLLTTPVVRGPAYAQGDGPEIEWERTYALDDVTSTLPGRVLPTSDGGYVLSVGVDSFPRNSNRSSAVEVVLLKLDGGGEILWQTGVVAPGRGVDYGSRILDTPVETRDGDYLVAGLEGGLSEEVPPTVDLWYLARIHSSGRILWRRNYQGACRDTLCGEHLTPFLLSHPKVAELDDGGYILVGRDACACRPVHLIVTDSDGRVTAEESIGPDLTHVPDRGPGTIERMTNGEFLFATTSSASDDRYEAGERTNLYLLRTDQTGGFVWLKEYDFGASETSRWNEPSVLPWKDGGALVAVRTISANASTATVVEIDAEGVVLSQRFLERPMNSSYMRQDRDGGFIFRWFNHGGDQRGMSVWKTDANFDLVWTWGPPEERAQSVEIVPDGGYVVVTSALSERESCPEPGGGVARNPFCIDARVVKLTSDTSFANFLRGDCNGDGHVSPDVADAVFLLTYNFAGGTPPPCLAACDANGDGDVLGQVTDAVYLLTHTFGGGAVPPEPFPECGSGAETDLALGCETPPDCRPIPDRDRHRP